MMMKFLFLLILLFSINLLNAIPELSVKYTCPYLPYSSGAAQLIKVANPSQSVLSVQAKAFDDDGVEYDLETVATIPAATVGSIGPEVQNALSDKGFQGGRIALEISLTDPEASVFFAYIVGASMRSSVPVQRELRLIPDSANPSLSSELTPSLRITYPYIPYSSSITQIFYLANTSQTAAEIKVTAFSDGDSYDLGTLEVPGRQVKKISNLLTDALRDQGFTNGELSVTLECANPGILAYASYATPSARNLLFSTREFFLPTAETQNP